MKKVFFILTLAFVSLSVYSQKGDLAVGLKGGYVYSPNYYSDALYGLDVAYHIADPFEIVFTGLMNPNVSYKNEWGDKYKLSVYSANLDLRLYLLMQRDWATGPALGGQYLVINNKTTDYAGVNTLGFNLGWHLRINVSDNLKINGGWRYTNAKDDGLDVSHNYFYAGLAYTFSLY
jgi:opacity protein-like surface antigen